MPAARMCSSRSTTSGRRFWPGTRSRSRCSPRGAGSSTSAVRWRTSSARWTCRSALSTAGGASAGDGANNHMKNPIDRRKFLKIAGVSLGFGALYRVAPALAAGGAADDVARQLVRNNGEGVTPFSFVQLSDTHVGFSGPPNPNGTQAFERAIELINGLPRQPELVLFTGDLTHDSENPGEHADRMRKFQQIAGRLRAPLVRYVPGEHDAGLDGGKLRSEEH